MCRYLLGKLCSARGDFGTPIVATSTNCDPLPKADCAWFFDLYSASGSQDLTSGYIADLLSNFSSDYTGEIGTFGADVGGLNTGNVVITSLSLAPASGLFAFSWAKSASANAHPGCVLSS